jgi:hypothetical protein
MYDAGTGTTICRNSAETPKKFRRNSVEQLRRNSAAPCKRSRRRSLCCRKFHFCRKLKKFLYPSDFFGSLVWTVTQFAVFRQSREGTDQVSYIKTAFPRETPKFTPFKTPGSSVFSGESATMTREQWRTKLRRRQNRRRRPQFKLARASIRGGETASIAAGAPRGDGHI